MANEAEPQRSRREIEGSRAPRARRSALLLELGALVYELHRRGRRAPELLQKKAAELDELDVDRHIGGKRKPDEIEAAKGGPCPACGESAEPGQLVCLNCGERLELGRDKQLTGKAGALAALIAVVVLGAGAAGFALSELTSGSETTEVAKRTPQPQPSPEPEPAPEAEGTAQPAKQSLLLQWPDDLRGHTVVLVNTSDRAAARRVASEAARSGLETGLLRSDDYDLGTGLWIVFAGRFDTRRGAERQAAGLGERYPGAYVQLVEPRSQ